MLDDYGMRLLAEMGIDVYRPRAPRGEASETLTPASSRPERTSSPPESDAPGRAPASTSPFQILGHESAPPRLLADLLRAARMAGLDAVAGTADSVQSTESLRGLIVLGESLARGLGAAMPAQRQNAITWVVATDATSLARDAQSKQALWGELKRLARNGGPATRRH